MICKLITFVVSLVTLFSISASAHDYKVIGYYPNWAIYRNPVFYPQDIDCRLVTHINYAFAKVDTAGNILLFDSWADTGYRSDWNSEQPFWGNFKALNDLKKKHPKLKTLISVGGWTLSDTFPAMADNPAARTNFAQSAVRFCHQYGFDGIDIDWEYPGFQEHSGTPKDKLNFTLLLAELHQAAKTASPPLLVTIAAPAGPWNIQQMEVDKIHHYLDWINVMTYDLHGPWADSENTITNHHSALTMTEQGHPQLNVTSVMQAYLDAGVPREKLVVGMPLYGRVFANTTGLHKPYNGAGLGTTQEIGMRFFYDIKQNLMRTYQLHWDKQAQVPYLYSPYNKEMVTFDNEESLRLKVQYLKSMGFGGAMVWELGLDVRPTWDAMNAIHNAFEE